MRGEEGFPADILEGTIVMIDLDNFEEVVKRRGWSQWRPNDATALLTKLVMDLVTKWRAVVIWGLDEERGTEEVVLEIPLTEPEELKEDLERIREELGKLGVGVSIVAIKDFVTLKEARNRREAYWGSHGRRRATKLLKSIKRKGGGKVLIL